MIIILLLVLVAFVVLCLFAFPALSPIPYFPSNRADIGLILNHIGLAKGNTIIDLGAGDGIVVMEAARKALELGLDTQFIAVEINPVLVMILHVRRLLNPNRRRIHIVWGDLFKMDYKALTRGHKSVTVYLYVSPWLMKKIMDRLNDQITRYTLVSYMYPIDEHVKEGGRGVHPLYKKAFTN